ncbi:hypothetical protein HanIR_Chr13g0635141 [Helianthus annuus]|nr:hypothetical protein HanIR_Chr13g0635141 [Helianthus annuus]
MSNEVGLRLDIQHCSLPIVEVRKKKCISGTGPGKKTGILYQRPKQKPTLPIGYVF